MVFAVCLDSWIFFSLVKTESCLPQQPFHCKHIILNDVIIRIQSTCGDFRHKIVCFEVFKDWVTLRTVCLTVLWCAISMHFNWTLIGWCSSGLLPILPCGHLRCYNEKSPCSPKSIFPTDHIIKLTPLKLLTGHLEIQQGQLWRSIMNYEQFLECLFSAQVKF